MGWNWSKYNCERYFRSWHWVSLLCIAVLLQFRFIKILCSMLPMPSRSRPHTCTISSRTLRKTCSSNLFVISNIPYWDNPMITRQNNIECFSHLEMSALNWRRALPACLWMLIKRKRPLSTYYNQNLVNLFESQTFLSPSCHIFKHAPLAAVKYRIRNADSSLGPIQRTRASRHRRGHLIAPREG